MTSAIKTQHYLVVFLSTKINFSEIRFGSKVAKNKSFSISPTVFKMSLKNIFIALSLAVYVKSLPLESQSLPKLLDDPVTYRLPNNSIPLRYDLSILSDIDKGIFEFFGIVRIHIRILVPTQRVTLHLSQLSVERIDLLNTDNSILQSNLVFEYEEALEFLIIALPVALELDEEIILDITYNGILRDDGRGFNRQRYIDDDGTDVWYATTMMKATYARYVMPCYDEPGFRAIMGLSIRHAKSYHAISNMPVNNVLDIGSDYVTTTFQDTFQTSSYLFGFAVTYFDYISNNNNQVEQRIYANPEWVAAGYADFALSIAQPIMIAIQEHLNVDYFLPKLDHVAIASQVWNGVENFGLITYRDENILIASADDSSARRNVIKQLAQEISQQWFGVLVPLKWWSSAWLSEGFAKLYGSIIPSIILPDDGYMEEFTVKARERVFIYDNGNLEPMNLYVETPSAVESRFSEILSLKSALVLRMFREALTVETFTKGLTFYLIENFLRPATPEDLHRSLQRAFDEDFPGNEIDIGGLMATWEDQVGYPIVNVQRNNDATILIQERFGGGREIYAIPISFATQSDPDFDDTLPKLWMTGATSNLDDLPEDNWIILNTQLTGYYNVNYDRNNWDSIITQLQNAHEIIPTIHRGQLFLDMQFPLLQESFEMTYGLELLNFLENEREHSVWTRALEVENIFSQRLFGTAVLPDYQNFIRASTQPHLDRLGFSEVEVELPEDAELRKVTANLSCKMLNEDCLNYELEKLLAFIDSDDEVYDFCDGVRLANESVHSQLVAMMLNSTNDRYTYIMNLGCSLDEEILRSFLELVLDDAVDFTRFQCYFLLGETKRQSTMALEITMEFIHEHYLEISRR